MGETRIAIVEHASMPGPRHTHEDWREAMHRDQRRRPSGLPPPIELGFDPIMVGPENIAHARGLPAFAQSHGFFDSVGGRRPTTKDARTNRLFLTTTTRNRPPHFFLLALKTRHPVPASPEQAAVRAFRPLAAAAALSEPIEP